MAKIKGTTKSGFEFKLDESIMDNMELIDVMAGIEEDASNMSKFVLMVLGSEQRSALYEHLRGKNGIVPSTKVYDEILEMIEIIGGEAGKN